MSERPNVIYRYDGTFDGFLTAVFEAYACKLPLKAVTAHPHIQTGFEDVIMPVATDEVKARRVEKGILSKFGETAFNQIGVCFWSGEFDKDTVLFRYIRAGFEQGRRIYYNVAHPDVMACDYLYKNITREEQRVKGFLRFSEMENGVFYARIQPKNSLVPIMMPHFADRFNDMPFLIHDAEHSLTGVYDGSGWYLVESGDLTLPAEAESEREFRRAWRRFYDAVAVQGRLDARLRRGMMPKFYWKNLPEFDPRYAPRR